MNTQTFTKILVTLHSLCVNSQSYLPKAKTLVSHHHPAMALLLFDFKFKVKRKYAYFNCQHLKHTYREENFTKLHFVKFLFKMSKEFWIERFFKTNHYVVTTRSLSRYYDKRLHDCQVVKRFKNTKS